MPLDDPAAAVGKPEVVNVHGWKYPSVILADGLGDGHDLSGFDGLEFGECTRVNRKESLRSAMNFRRDVQGNFEGLSGSNWK